MLVVVLVVVVVVVVWVVEPGSALCAWKADETVQGREVVRQEAPGDCRGVGGQAATAVRWEPEAGGVGSASSLQRTNTQLDGSGSRVWQKQTTGGASREKRGHGCVGAAEVVDDRFHAGHPQWVHHLGRLLGFTPLGRGSEALDIGLLEVGGWQPEHCDVERHGLQTPDWLAAVRQHADGVSGDCDGADRLGGLRHRRFLLRCLVQFETGDCGGDIYPFLPQLRPGQSVPPRGGFGWA